MKDAVSQRQAVDSPLCPPCQPSRRGPGKRRGRTGRTGGGRRSVSHRTPLELADASVARLVDDLVEEAETEALAGPELLDPGFDAAEDLGSFVRLSVVTTALCGTWATWVSDEAE